MKFELVNRADKVGVAALAIPFFALGFAAIGSIFSPWAVVVAFLTLIGGGSFGLIIAIWNWSKKPFCRNLAIGGMISSVVLISLFILGFATLTERAKQSQNYLDQQESKQQNKSEMATPRKPSD